MESGSSARTLQQGKEETTTGHPRTRGRVNTSGPDYEVALCSLFFLRALRVCSDFFLASNYQPAANFDDVVLFYRLKEDRDHEYRAIFLQAKHKATEREIPLSSRSPFILKEYLESFKKIRNLWEQPLNLDHRRITLKDVTLVLYTNTERDAGEIACDVTDHPELQHLQDFLNTGGRLLRITEAQGAHLPQGKDTSDFLRKLLLCIHQMSVNTTDQFLQEEVRKVLRLTSVGVANKLTAELKRVVRTWWSEESNGRYLTADSEEWNAVLHMQVTLLNVDTLTVDSEMNLGFSVAAVEDLDVVSRHMKMIWIPVTDTHQASLTRVSLLRAQSKSLVLGAKYLADHWEDVEALWGKSVCPTLVIDLINYSQWEDSSQLLERLRKAAEIVDERHLVVVAAEQPPSGGWNVVELPTTWSALDTQTQERLLSVKVQLQGNYVVELRDIVDSSVNGVMTDKIIKSLFVTEPPIRLGEMMPPPLDYYVPRCLLRTSSRTITYQSLQNTNTLMLSDYWKCSFPSYIKVKHLTTDDLEMTENIDGLILLRGVVSESGIRKMCCKFHIKGVRGKVESEGLTGRVTEFIPLTWICEDKVMVVEGLPGVGKSSYVTAMCSMAKKQFPEAWVLRVDMARHTEYIKGADFTCTSDIMEFLLKPLPKHSLERHLLEHALRVTGNVFLFLDAFDEINPDYTAQCCELLKGIAKRFRYRQMVVTTRPVTAKDVQGALETEAFTLPVFTPEEQTLFFTQFSVAKGKRVDKEEITLLRETVGSVIEIPLLCKMSAEILLNRHDQSSLNYKYPWRQVLLYQIFVEQCVNHHLSEKIGIEASMPGARTLLETSKKQHFRNLQGLAVSKLMPEVELANIYDEVPEEKLGLVVNTGESVDFEHRTFAEYFLGCWLSDNWHHFPRNRLRDALLQNGSQFVAATLRWCLFQDFPLHVAVARGDAEAARKELLLSSAGTTDRGGRSALHVAAMTPGCSREILEMLVASGEDVNRKDDILATSAAQFAEIERNWEFVEVMVEKGVILKNLNFFTDQDAAKEILIHAIQRDLANFINYILTLNKQLLHVRVGFDRKSLLHVAAFNGSAGVLKLLIDSGIQTNIRNIYGDTAFTLAAREGNFQIVRLLIQSGAATNIRNKNGNTAITWAAMGGHLQVVRLLLESAVEKNIKNKNGDTALMLAAWKGYLDIVKLLIRSGAETNLVNKNGETALMLAAREGNLDVVKLLIDSGIETNVKNNNGDTAFTLAAREGNLEVVKLLIEGGVETNVINKNGDTAFTLASKAGHRGVMDLLMEKGVDMTVDEGNDADADAVT